MAKRRRSSGSMFGGLGAKIITALVVLTVLFTGWRIVPGEGETLFETLKAKNASLKSWYENKNLDGIQLPSIDIDVPGLGGGSGSSGDSGKPSLTKAEAEKALDKIPSQNPKKVSYDRDEWKHWSNITSCWNVREQVLYDEAEKGSIVLLDSKNKKTDNVKNACKIQSGTWKEFFSGKTVNDPSKLDIDHMIPLSYAAKQGGQSWDKKKKEKYANDLTYENHLIAVDASANRKKGDQGPSNWKPSNKNYHCTYATSWITIAKNYQLPLPDADKKALRDMLKTC